MQLLLSRIILTFFRCVCLYPQQGWRDGRLYKNTESRPCTSTHAYFKYFSEVQSLGPRSVLTASQDVEPIARAVLCVDLQHPNLHSQFICIYFTFSLIPKVTTKWLLDPGLQLFSIKLEMLIAGSSVCIYCPAGQYANQQGASRQCFKLLHSTYTAYASISLSQTFRHLPSLESIALHPIQRSKPNSA